MKNNKTKKYSSEVIRFINYFIDIYGKKNLDEDQRASLSTRVNYLISVLEKDSGLPLSILKRNMQEKEFAKFITYIYGDLSDKENIEEEYTNFTKIDKRKYIEYINKAKYQYIFRYFTNFDFRTYYGSTTFAGFLDSLIEPKNTKGTDNFSLKMPVYMYYLSKTKKISFWNKTIIRLLSNYYNEFNHINFSNSYLEYSKFFFLNFISHENHNDIYKYIDTASNILLDAIDDFFNLFILYFDMNFELFKERKYLDYMVKKVKEYNEYFNKCLDEALVDSSSYDNLFVKITLFEKYIGFLHYNNIQRKMKVLYTDSRKVCSGLENENKYSLKQLSQMSIDSFINQEGNEKLKELCSGKTNTADKTFLNKIELFENLNKYVGLSRDYSHNKLYIPEIKIIMDINNVLDLKVLYQEMVVRGEDSKKVFGKHNNNCRNMLCDIIDSLQDDTLFFSKYEHNEEVKKYNNNKPIYYKTTNENLSETITDKYNEKFSLAYAHSVFLTEKLRRGYYRELEASDNYVMLQELKFEIINIFEKILSIFDIESQYVFFLDYTDNIKKIIKNFEMIYSLKNKEVWKKEEDYTK